MAIYTVPGNLLSTYDSGFFGSGNAASAIIHHEDLTDVATILDSSQCPFFAGAPKIRARDVVHSWPIDSLAAPSSAGAFDGADFSSGDAQTPPSRLYNTTQIFRRDVVVSDRERESNPAGVRDMYEHQTMKKFKEITRDFETTFWRCGATTGTATGAEGVANAPAMAGIQGAFGGPTIYTSGSGGCGAFLTADLVTVCQNMFTNGAEPDSLWLAPVWKTLYMNSVYGTGTIAGAVRSIAADDKRLVANVEVWESPFSQLLQVIVDRFIPSRLLSASGAAWFVGDRSMAKIAFFRPPRHTPLSKTGDNTKGMVMMEATFHIDHPSSWGQVTGITAATGLV